MKPAPLVLTCVLVSVTLAYGTVILFPPAGAADVTPVPRAETEEVVLLRQKVEGMGRELEALRARVAGGTVAGGRQALTPDPELVEQAVRHWLKENAAKVQAELAGGGKQGKNPAGKAFSVKDAFGRLQNPDLDWDAKAAIWSNAHEAGKMGELAAFYKARANADPQDPQAQTDYGNALIQQTQFEKNDMKKGVLAMQADKQFDKALQLNDHHWEARFSKAVSLSFWPAAFGKGKVAIEHFETLVRQQEGVRAEPHHAQTFIFLGNMYSQQGKDDKAKEVWNRGLGRFPGNETLQGKLGR